MFSKESLQFLKNLKKNNQKVWFDANRKTYENARTEALQVNAELLKHLAKKDERFASLQPKDCMFRINRDIRFSKDKSPYKTHFGLVFTPGGKSSIKSGFYVHIEPGASFAGGGIWAPEPAVLAAIRQEIDYNFKEWKGIVEKASFKNLFGTLDQSDKLSRPPKGYEADNPALEYLKLKHFVVGTRLSDEALQGKGLIQESAKAFDALLPMLNFLDRAIS